MAHRPLPQVTSSGTPLFPFQPKAPVKAHPELHELVKHGAHVAGVGPQECLDQLLLLLAQLCWRLLCPPLGLLRSPHCQCFRRQDHCARGRRRTTPLRPTESTSLCQPPVWEPWGTPHGEGCGKGGAFLRPPCAWLKPWSLQWQGIPAHCPPPRRPGPGKQGTVGGKDGWRIKWSR